MTEVRCGAFSCRLNVILSIQLPNIKTNQVSVMFPDVFSAKPHVTPWESSSAINSMVLNRKDHGFTRDLLHQQFQGTIILMVFDLQGTYQQSNGHISPSHFLEITRRFSYSPTSIHCNGIPKRGTATDAKLLKYRSYPVAKLTALEISQVRQLASSFFPTWVFPKIGVPLNHPS